PMNAILLVSAVGFGSREAPVNNQLNLDLFLGGENVAVKGNVTDPNGQPVAGAKVVESGNPANTTTTNDQGTFEIDVPSDATLLVTAAGFAPSQSPVQGKAEQNIQLFPTT
ncbi:MAG: carboxypeptidase regulatory-like domain-containing protein, partial [Bacteroidota bacterium]